jgi:hypothetical protein
MSDEEDFYFGLDNSPRRLPACYEVIATDDPCIDPGCQKEIQPGQSYVPTDNGPLHVGCGRS